MGQGLEALLLWCQEASVTYQSAQQGTNWETPGQAPLFLGLPLDHLGTGTRPCSPVLLSNPPWSYCQWWALKKARFGDYEGLTEAQALVTAGVY